MRPNENFAEGGWGQDVHGPPPPLDGFALSLSVNFSGTSQNPITSYHFIH